MLAAEAVLWMITVAALAVFLHEIVDKNTSGSSLVN